MAKGSNNLENVVSFSLESSIFSLYKFDFSKGTNSMRSRIFLGSWNVALMSRSGTSIVDDEPSPMLPPSDGYKCNNSCVRFSNHCNITQYYCILYSKNLSLEFTWMRLGPKFLFASDSDSKQYSNRSETSGRWKIVGPRVS